MSDTDNNGRALRKGFSYFRLLAGHEVEGLRPGAIAKALGLGPATVTRDMRALKDAGVVEQVPGMEERWRLGPAVVQIALAHMHGLERVTARMTEVKQRYSREPK